MNSVNQLLFRFLEQCQNFQLNTSREGSLSKCLFETAHNASSCTDVGDLKIGLVQYDTFYCGQIQQDSSESLVMLIEIINKRSVSWL